MGHVTLVMTQDGTCITSRAINNGSPSAVFQPKSLLDRPYRNLHCNFLDTCSQEGVGMGGECAFCTKHRRFAFYMEFNDQIVFIASLKSQVSSDISAYWLASWRPQLKKTLGSICLVHRFLPATDFFAVSTSTSFQHLCCFLYPHYPGS